jgi:hypothetical protein
MKKFNFLALSIVFIGLITLSSCSKETKIEKNLWKKGGEWNVESFSAKQTSTFAPDNFDETLVNIGTYTFNENGTGIYKNIGELEPLSFTYSNTENKLSFTIGTDSQVYDIVEWKKDNIKFSYTENFYDGVDGNVGTGTYTEIITLKKK